jgi:hypothetical protein
MSSISSLSADFGPTGMFVRGRDDVAATDFFSSSGFYLIEATPPISEGGLRPVLGRDVEAAVLEESYLIKLVEVTVGFFKPLPMAEAPALAVRFVVFFSAAALLLGELYRLDLSP